MHALVIPLIRLMEISFIIPYYEVAPWLLRRCLNSVCAFMQQIPDCSWEAWVVDDGSVDADAARLEVEHMGVAQICCLRVPHGGLGAARNVGLEHAGGVYVFFLDADDYLFVQAAVPLLACCRQRQPDVLSFGMQPVRCTEQEHPNHPVSLRICYEGSGAGYMVQHNLRAAACGYMFRRESLGNLRFMTGIFHEDEAFTPRLWLKAQKVCVTSFPVYAYYQRNDSIVHVSGRDQLEKRMADLRLVLNGLQQENTQTDLQQKALQRRIDTLASDVWWRLVCESPDAFFMHSQFRSLRKIRGYPLPFHFYTLRYILMYIGSRCGLLAVLGNRISHLKQLFSSKNQ